MQSNFYSLCKNLLTEKIEKIKVELEQLDARGREECLKLESERDAEIARLEQEFRMQTQAVQDAHNECRTEAMRQIAIQKRSRVEERSDHSAILAGFALVHYPSCPEALPEPVAPITGRIVSRRILLDVDNETVVQLKCETGTEHQVERHDSAPQDISDANLKASGERRVLTRLRKQTDFFANEDHSPPSTGRERGSKFLDKNMRANFTELVIAKRQQLCGSGYELLALWNQDTFFRQAYVLIYEAWQRGYNNIPRAVIDAQLNDLILSARQENLPSGMWVSLDTVRQGMCAACRLPRQLSIRFFPDATAPVVWKEFGAECAGMIEAVYDFVGILRLLIAELKLGANQHAPASIADERVRDHWHLFQECFLKIEDMREHMRTRYTR